MQTSMQKNYHSIFVVNTDIYNLAGPTVFDELQGIKDDKNLIVIPSGFIDKLNDFSNEIMGTGAKDVLEYLTQLKAPERSEDGKIKLFKKSDNLSVLFLENATSFDSIEKILSEQNFHSTTKPEIITSESRLHLHHAGGYFEVTEPGFLSVNKDIVNKGILIGNENLLANLQESKTKSLPIEKAAGILKEKTLYPNQFVKFIGAEEGKAVYARVTGIPRYNKAQTMMLGMDKLELTLLDSKEYGKKIKFGESYREDVFGIRPNDMEQYLALQYGILNPDISLFFLSGLQGSGKTLLSYVGAVDQVSIYMDHNERKSRKVSDDDLGRYKQILIFTPTDIIGGERRNLGYLPGNTYDKLKPHLGKYEDQHNKSDLGMLPFPQMLCHPAYDTEYGPQRTASKIGQEVYLPDTHPAISIVHTGFLRGRSFSNVIAWIDEAQNMTPYEVKTIIQRLGEGCKCIITGDPNQTDNPMCTREINGLTHSIKFFMDKPYSSLVHLTKNYRSQMSKESDTWKVYAK